LIDPDVDIRDFSESDFPGGFIPLHAPRDFKKIERDVEDAKKQDEGKQLTEKDVELSMKESYKYDIFDVYTD
jgi:hypothetical protein